MKKNNYFLAIVLFVAVLFAATGTQLSAQTCNQVEILYTGNDCFDRDHQDPGGASGGKSCKEIAVCVNQPYSYTSSITGGGWNYAGGKLVSADATVSIPLTPEAIIAGIENGELIPSVLLTFLMMYCYYGATCLGGIGQTGYLPQIQTAWIKLMQAENRQDEIAVCEKLFGSNLGGEITVAYIDSLNGVFAPATSLDLIVYRDDDARACMIGQAKSITLNEAMDPQ